MSIVNPTTDPPPFRPPAIPLVAHDPYFSVWSFHDDLSGDWTRHWTGAAQCMAGQVRIDGQTYRFCGLGPSPAMKQMRLEVLPTRTIYRFQADGVELTLTFTTPSLPDDLDLLSRPITYVSFEVRSIDAKAHDVQLYLDVQTDWVVDSPGQQVVWSRHRLEGMDVLRVGSVQQPILGRKGDNLRIDWGYLYLVIEQATQACTWQGQSEVARRQFAQSGTLPTDDDMDMPRAVSDRWPVLAVTWNLGKVGEPSIQQNLLLAYDDLFAIEFLHRKLPAYWRRDGKGIVELLRESLDNRPEILARCVRFDEKLMAELRAAGGEKYARLCALAFRQCLAAHKLVADIDGTPMYFSKENFSNGCIATVDVTYPGAPFFLHFNPDLLQAQIEPVLHYASTRRWKFPFAPHDLGTYPLANGQVYGGGEKTEEKQMPVEECGNMLLLVAALAKARGHGDYARRYWKLLTRWADYLMEKGYNPENQLCTDDFAGRLAGNTNLSIKAILALAGYAMLCRMIGGEVAKTAARYDSTAREWANRWMTDAADGDHYRLAFDQPGTWSQKYNLVWDRLLDLNVFPPELAKKEMVHYRKMNTRFGLPLDSRKTYTKLDWIVWTATLTGSDDDFRALVDPLYDWAHQTPTRVPLTDWYETSDGRQVGFQARSVVGGIFIKLLGERVGKS